MISSESAGPEPFGKYLLDREIARGGMARVHLARLRGLGGFEKRLVVKQILPHLASDPRFVSMFVEEAKTLVQMSHPHIVPVYELGIVDGVYFLAMEYVEGATLSDILDEGALDPAEAAHVGAQICDALSYAHERFGIVHRDVTPRNVIIDAAGHCRLLDFGIAAPATDDADGELFGTPGYLSPEQARGDAVGPSSDLFGVGALLWHALVGSPPFDLSSIDEVRALRPGGPRARLADRDIEPELAALVDRALDPDPAARPESANALTRALRGWLASRHPEGIAPELGARAERARARRERHRASSRPPAMEVSSATAPHARTPARTLAQSRALDEIIEGTAPLARASTPVAIVGEEAEPRPPEPVGGGTVPLPGRVGRDAAPTAPPARRSTAPIVIALAALTALAAVVIGTVTREDASAELAPAASPPHAMPSEAIEPASDPLAAEPGSGPTPGLGPGPPPGPAPGPAPGADPDPAPPSAGRVALAVSATRGWASITLDGRPLGTTPIMRTAIASGAHTIIARNDALGREARSRFRAEPGARVHLVVDLEADPPRVTVIER